MTKLQELIAKLREIFQIDKPELDFGIYRILNARAKQIDAFLENDLPGKVRTALQNNAEAGRIQLKKELGEAEANAKSLGMNPDDVPRVRELRTRWADEQSAALDRESQVYSHLLTFFSRYYETGDFVSKRRYKGDVYAIPYSGEEVKLHWANADQYYTKSGENFTNYDFKLDDGTRIHFKLVSAATAKDNLKDNDAVRCFVLWDPEQHPVPETTDEDAEVPEQPKSCLEAKDGELFIYFEYKLFPKRTKQKDLAKAARSAIAQELGRQGLSSAFNIFKPARTDKDQDRTVFDKEFTRYTARNTNDYFIHKDLKGFLARELDFYIKNEMMQLDDLQSAESFQAIEINLRQIQAVRSIGKELIGFMAQIEEFQKKLWLKKKFVTRCDYCLTLDRVPAELHAQIFANTEQKAEWALLGFPEHPEGLFADKRMVDTKFFDEAFKAKLLASIPNLDEQCDGLLIHSENFQALNLLQERYREQVKCIYIDPPYNTGKDGFVYKDNYQSSSWLSMICDRAMVSARLLREDDAFFAMSIDKHQMYDGKILLSMIVPDYKFVNSIVNVNNPKGRSDQKHLPTAHDNILLFATSGAISHGWKPQDKVLRRYRLQDEEGKYREIDLRKTGDNDLATDRPKMAYAFAYNEATQHLYPLSLSESMSEIPVGYIKIWPMVDSETKGRWRWEYATANANLKRLVAKYQPQKKQWTVFEKDRLDDDETVFPTSVWDEKAFNSERGSEQLERMSFGNCFSRPKTVGLLEHLIEHLGGQIILDYFAGSGTTGHAVINLNREDKGNRKYILVEMGEYFDTVLKPRIQKVVYAPDWKDGKPTAADKGVSHCFKYLTLESYEDTLGNLQLADTDVPEMLREKYLLEYMLAIESRGSLLSTDSFKKPFDYALNIAVDSSGATRPQKVDLVETFNYLLGLRVGHVNRQVEKGFIMVDGMLANGDAVLIIWRDCEKVPEAELNRLLATRGVKPGDSEFAAVYVNGDHAIANVTLGNNGLEKTLKVRQIENEFLARMFEEA